MRPLLMRKALFLHKRVIYELLYHHYELEKKIYSTQDSMQVKRAMHSNVTLSLLLRDWFLGLPLEGALQVALSNVGGGEFVSL
jgi:hypothetical protein